MTLQSAAIVIALLGGQVQPLPKWNPPYTLLPVQASAIGLHSRLNGENTAVWLEGDVLTILHRSEAAAVAVTGGLQMPLAKVPASDLWILQLKMQGWEEGFLDYLLIEDGKYPQHATFRSWRGVRAPAKPASVAELQGKVESRMVPSMALGRERGIQVYVPPNSGGMNIPAVFFADGLCEPMARIMEPLMLSGKVRPFAIVGVTNGGYAGDRAAQYDPDLDDRANEYVPGANDAKFDRHMKFFTEEVPRYVHDQFGITLERDLRAVGGFSNGGAFSAAVAFRHPEVFGHVMPLSVGVPPNYPKPAGALPRMYLAAGTLESFIRGTTRVYEQAKEWGAEAELRTFVAGHDFGMWTIALVEFLQKIFRP